MRRIAIINQKGGVGKTTTTVNLGAALALLGRRVALIDLDPQANLSLHLDVSIPSNQASTYTVLIGDSTFADALRPTRVPNLELVASNIDLSGAELELASAIGRESLLRDALDTWERDARAKDGRAPADYVLIDCPPSLGLLSINGLVAANAAIITLQTEFFALQGMSKLVDVFKLLKKRLNPSLEVVGILPCLYDHRLKLAREVLSEIRNYFPEQVFARTIGKNVKLAESPSYGKTIFEYAADCSGSIEYLELALELMQQEAKDADLASLARPARDELERVIARLTPEKPRPAPPRRPTVEKRAAESAPSAETLREVVITPPAPAEAADPAPAARAPIERNGAGFEPIAELRDFAPSEPPVAVAELPPPEPVLANRLLAYEVALPIEELPELPDDAFLIADENG